MIDLTLSPEALTASLVDVPSVSGSEGRLADEVERVLRELPHLQVRRDGDAIAATTNLGRQHRVVIAGHLDTVPIADNMPSRRDGDRLFGCGTSDMKSGIAVMLRVAATLAEPRHDVTWLFYDNEEVEAARNGLGRVARNSPEWLHGDLAVLMEPTANRVEAGCQGTMRAIVVVTGRRAHSARSWLGDNAIHKANDVLARLAGYVPRRVEIDGCEFREGLNAVRIEGGVAGNVVPDRCTITINYRFAPDRDEAGALAHVQEVLAPYEVVPTDSSAGALPRLSEPAAKEFVETVGGGSATAKLGWTDVARFAALGIPAVNFGPGDPNLAHTREEHVEIPRISECERILRGYLSG
jgi:succinyl-diaminopimelate desuccinylase